jgi:hypothetical protein
MTGAVITDYGRKADLNRYLNSSSSYLPPTVIRIGMGTTNPLTSDTDIEIPVPISDGTINDDGSNTFTGSNGADNSTDNTTTYKEGAGVSDNVAQNLIANDTSETKTWTISDLSSAGTIVDEEQPISLWFYIKDQTTLDKFKTSGTCLEIKVGSDSSNYYSIIKEASDLSTGWNWITTNTDNVEDLTETGTVSGDIDTYIIEITTNNATDEFEAGDVVVDLLRQWEESDLSQVYSTGYPSYNDADFTATIKSRLGATAGTGFNISELGLFDTDGNMHVRIVFDAESKDSTDEFEMQPVIDTEV